MTWSEIERRIETLERKKEKREQKKKKKEKKEKEKYHTRELTGSDGPNPLEEIDSEGDRY